MAEPRRLGRKAGVAGLVLLGLGALPGGILGQVAVRAWFPAESYFTVTIAAPREPRFAGGLISTDLLGHPRDGSPPAGGAYPDREEQAMAALGGTLRLWRPARWNGGGVIVGLQAGVFGRFRMEGSNNALVAADWLAALPVEARSGRLSGRARLLHWSAHLGDEFIENSGARRVDFTFEAVDVLAAYDLGGLRLYGGGAGVLRSQLEDAEDAPEGFTDDGTLQVGADGGWYPWARGTVGFRGGLDLQWSDRSDWRRQISGVAAFEARGRERAFQVGVSFFDGPSPLGQFYLNEESSWGFEIRVDL